MEIIRRTLGPLVKKEYLWLCLLVIVILGIHFSIITRPSEPIFDEQHYVPEARSILQGHDALHPEHPSLGKLFIAFGIYIFGDNPYGWRFFSVLFGMLCIVLFYLICRQLAIPKKVSFLITFLLATENLSFIQASVAMLDVYSLTFMLLSFWLYLKGRYLLSGVSVALSALAKLTGVLALPVILLHCLLTRRARPGQYITLIFMAVAAFLLLMPLFDFFVFGRFISPVERIIDMVTTSSSLTFATATHEALSRPWEWILQPKIMSYWYTPHYISAISFTIWVLIIPSVAYMVFLAARGHRAVLFGVLWFVCTYLLWIPLSIITDRISFVYYFYPTIGAIYIGLGLGFSRIIGIWETERAGKLKWIVMSAVIVYLLLHIGTFIALSPLLSLWAP